MRVHEAITALTDATGNRLTRRLYAKYLTYLDERVGSKELEDVRPSDIRAIMTVARERAVIRSRTIDGASAAEHTLTSCRALWYLMIMDGETSTDPTMGIPKPPRQENTREPIRETQLHELFDAVSDDETLVLRLLLETALRRQEFLDLTPASVRLARQTIVVIGKGSKRREQPISSLMSGLLSDPGSPLHGWTRRRLDGLWDRTRRQLPWAAERMLSTHDMRRTAITMFEAATGSYPLAARFAGHTMPGTTGTYILITMEDLARGWSVYAGETHPLAQGGH